MKFTQNDYNLLERGINEFLDLFSKEELNEGINEFVHNSKANNKFVAFIWAIFFKVSNNDQTIKDMIRERDYLDAHIQTALKKIFKAYGITEFNNSVKTEF